MHFKLLRSRLAHFVFGFSLDLFGLNGLNHRGVDILHCWWLVLYYRTWRETSIWKHLKSHIVQLVKRGSCVLTTTSSRYHILRHCVRYPRNIIYIFNWRYLFLPLSLIPHFTLKLSWLIRYSKFWLVCKDCFLDFLTLNKS